MMSAKNQGTPVNSVLTKVLYYVLLLIMKIIINKVNDVMVKKRIAVIACNNIGVGGVIRGGY
jgi:hypothetical protein